MEIIFTERKKNRTITVCKPVLKSWSNTIEIDEEKRYYYVTESAWDLIREKTKSKLRDHATKITEEDDELRINLKVQIKQQEEKPSE